jgi:Pterin 4 alpha carbinolamine dehydratase
MADLAGKTCVPCRGGVPPLRGKELQDLAKQVSGWKVVNEHHITKSFTFPDFKGALAFRLSQPGKPLSNQLSLAKMMTDFEINSLQHRPVTLLKG